MGGYFSQPENNSAPEIKVILESFKQKQDMMPSPEDIERFMAVRTGHAQPETREEEEFAPGETNQEKFMHDKLLSSRFVAGAYDIQTCICRIVTDGGEFGTGFRISENLIMTAAHVLEESSEGYVQFHYHEVQSPNFPGNSIPESSKHFRLRPDLLYYSNRALDFAVVAISGSGEELKDVGIITIFYTKSVTGQHTNIFSHPEGQPMKVSLRQNLAIEKPQKPIAIGLDKAALTKEQMSSKPHVIIHEADTKGGSSGAPVFNDRWQLVAIHQGYTVEKRDDEDANCVGNYACLIKYILEDLYSKNGESLTKFEEALKDHAKDVGIPFKDPPKHTENFRKHV